jgi:uncharacterized oxidoreductase
MNLSNSTVLITGGTSGIGLELAKQLLELGSVVIVTGRDQSKLDQTKKSLPKIHCIQSDVSDPEAIKKLFTTVTKDFPDLNVLMNNAGIMRKLNFHDKGADIVDITKEIEINLMGPIRMTTQFLPFLKTQSNAAIVNVSSGLAFVPFALSPVYSATKAGLHAFSQALRVQLKKTPSVVVFELAPPGTNTPLFKSDFDAEELKSIPVMSVETLAKKAIEGLQQDCLEICPGLSNVLKWMSRIAPQFAVNTIGKSAIDLPSKAKSLRVE